jgi:hypothetical protein
VGVQVDCIETRNAVKGRMRSQRRQVVLFSNRYNEFTLDFPASIAFASAVSIVTHSLELSHLPSQLTLLVVGGVEHSCTSLNLEEVLSSLSRSQIFNSLKVCLSKGFMCVPYSATIAQEASPPSTPNLQLSALNIQPLPKPSLKTLRLAGNILQLALGTHALVSPLDQLSPVLPALLIALVIVVELQHFNRVHPDRYSNQTF